MSERFEGPLHSSHNVVRGLGMAKLCLFEESPTLRTGAVIEGVHLALEAAMVCALGSASLRTKGDTTKTHFFDDLLLLCQQPDRMKFGHPIDPSQVDALKQLHDDDHRGAFMHTRPAPWSVPIDNREVVLAALTAIEQLMDGCPWDTLNPIRSRASTPHLKPFVTI